LIRFIPFAHCRSHDPTGHIICLRLSPNKELLGENGAGGAVNMHKKPSGEPQLFIGSERAFANNLNGTIGDLVKGVELSVKIEPKLRLHFHARIARKKPAITCTIHLNNIKLTGRLFPHDIDT